MRRLFLFAAIALLTACATPLPEPGAPIEMPRAGIDQAFVLDARFTLHLDAPMPGAAKSASGQLYWKHAPSADYLLLSGPLGQSLAELQRDAAGARLRLSNGEERTAADLGRLLQEALGIALPIDRLSFWLRGAAGPHGQMRQDRLGRPLQLFEEGWRIEYAYEGAETTPARLTVLRENELELRLRIEEWQIDP